MQITVGTLASTGNGDVRTRYIVTLSQRQQCVLRPSRVQDMRVLGMCVYYSHTSRYAT